MTIPDPVAWPEDPVDVRNYRSRLQLWEPGVLVSIVYHPPARPGGTTGEWRYRVRLNRLSPSNQPMHLTVAAPMIIPRF